MRSFPSPMRIAPFAAVFRFLFRRGDEPTAWRANERAAMAMTLRRSRVLQAGDRDAANES